MRERLLAFFHDLDSALMEIAAGEKLDIYHIGRSALFWQFESGAATSDVDVLAPHDSEHLLRHALALFGRETNKATEHGLYLQIVPDALPPMPGGYETRAQPIPGTWQVLRVFQLDLHDLAVSKLKRFAARDREDIQQLCDMGSLDSDQLRERLESAFYWHMEKDGNVDRDRAFENFYMVRDYLNGDIAAL